MILAFYSMPYFLNKLLIYSFNQIAKIAVIAIWRETYIYRRLLCMCNLWGLVGSTGEARRGWQMPNT